MSSASVSRIAPVARRLGRNHALLEDLLALLTPHVIKYSRARRGSAAAADAANRDRAEHRADDRDGRERGPHRRVAGGSPHLQAHERRQRESHRGRAAERAHVGTTKILRREPGDGRLGDGHPEHLADHEEHQDDEDHRQQRAHAEDEERQPHQQHRHHPAPGRGNARHAPRQAQLEERDEDRVDDEQEAPGPVGTPWLSTSEIGSTVSYAT